MTAQQMSDAMQSGVLEFHNHTYNLHYLVNGKAAALVVSDADLEDDFERMNVVFTEATLPSPAAIAYPYGQHDQRLRQYAKKHGQHLGLTTEIGLAEKGSDPMRVKRLIVFPSISREQFAKMLP